MRPLTPLLALVLVFGLVPAAAAAPPNTVYVALGDSLAVGDGASNPDETGYVALMADYFAGTPHGNAKSSVNLAVVGETTSSFLAGQATAAVNTILAPDDVTVVTLSLGGNDLLNLLNEPTDPCVQDPGSATCQALLAAALGEVAATFPLVMGTISSALSQDPGAELVYVLTSYNPFGGTGSPFEGPIDLALLGYDLTVDCAASAGNPIYAGLNDIVACTAGAFGAIVVDGYATIGDDALALTHIGDPGFNIHPNDDGYAAIAKAHRRAMP